MLKNNEVGTSICGYTCTLWVDIHHTIIHSILQRGFQGVGKSRRPSHLEQNDPFTWGGHRFNRSSSSTFEAEQFLDSAVSDSMGFTPHMSIPRGILDEESDQLVAPLWMIWEEGWFWASRPFSGVTMHPSILLSSKVGLRQNQQPDRSAETTKLLRRRPQEFHIAVHTQKQVNKVRTEKKHHKEPFLPKDERISAAMLFSGGENASAPNTPAGAWVGF